LHPGALGRVGAVEAWQGAEKGGLAPFPPTQVLDDPPRVLGEKGPVVLFPQPGSAYDYDPKVPGKEMPNVSAQ